MLIELLAARRRDRRGFSLMELLIVIAIILIILAVALPKVDKARMNANEMAVIRQIGTIHTAQAQYLSQFGKYATTLAELGPPTSGQPGPAASDLIPQSLASGQKDGHIFQMQGTPGGYTINVNPQAYGSTGRRTFYSDQSLVIKQNWGPEPATASSKELQ
jgi:type IV pilus assembly protein PilA